MNYKIFDAEKHKHLDWCGFRWLVAYIGGKKQWHGNIMGSFQTKVHARIFRDVLNKMDYYSV